MRTRAVLLVLLALGCQTAEWDPEINQFQYDHARCFDAATGGGPGACHDCSGQSSRLWYGDCMLALGWTPPEFENLAPSF